MPQSNFRRDTEFLLPFSTGVYSNCSSSHSNAELVGLAHGLVEGFRPAVPVEATEAQGHTAAAAPEVLKPSPSPGSEAPGLCAPSEGTTPLSALFSADAAHISTTSASRSMRLAMQGKRSLHRIISGVAGVQEGEEGQQSDLLEPPAVENSSPAPQDPLLPSPLLTAVHLAAPHTSMAPRPPSSLSTAPSPPRRQHPARPPAATRSCTESDLSALQQPGSGVGGAGHSLNATPTGRLQACAPLPGSAASQALGLGPLVATAGQRSCWAEAPTAAAAAVAQLAATAATDVTSSGSKHKPGRE
ncbi:hypothetical protein V8C86DRAFT_2939808 [Haematococcus lacustris]